MEVINYRFPHITEKILKHVDNQSFVNFKESSKGNYNFINGEKFYWIRILQNCCQSFYCYSEYWKKICRTTPVEVVWELAVAAIQLSETFNDKKYWHWSPLHLAAAFGKLELYKRIEEKIREMKSLQNLSIPLHVSAYHGSLEIFKYLLEKSCNKNPKNKSGVTPLHLAVTNGHFDICILLIANVSDMNLSDRTPFGRTLLYEAAIKVI